MEDAVPGKRSMCQRSLGDESCRESVLEHPGGGLADAGPDGAPGSPAQSSQEDFQWRAIVEYDGTDLSGWRPSLLHPESRHGESFPASALSAQGAC
jgi:hypothetical protein